MPRCFKARAARVSAPRSARNRASFMPSLSATIITLNEAAHIERALRSLSFADEIVVVDSGSTDETCAIAQRLGARVVQHPFEGFAAQKNFAASQARLDWILSLDADEELDATAQAALEKWKTREPSAPGYCFARRAFYLGRWIFHSGWYPDYKLRLYHRHQGAWRGGYVHESVVVQGGAQRLEGEILHYTCDSLEDHGRRIEFYTDKASQEMLARGEKAGWLKRWAVPPWTFANTYIVRLGILDGHQGFLIAWMAARYVARKYAKLQDLHAKAKARRS